jgi:hypothetical protein
MSNLAHAYLRDRAPQLLDYELGFQLLEKNEDSDRAVGVFGFKVGPQLLYAPVFFLHGELQGHELCYLKESDTFVPMKENWINYILNRKPNVIGDHVMSQLNRLGVDRPSMDPFRLSPSRTHKYGSDRSAAGIPGAPMPSGGTVLPGVSQHPFSQAAIAAGAGQGKYDPVATGGGGAPMPSGGTVLPGVSQHPFSQAAIAAGAGQGKYDPVATGGGGAPMPPPGQQAPRAPRDPATLPQYAAYTDSYGKYHPAITPPGQQAPRAFAKGGSWLDEGLPGLMHALGNPVRLPAQLPGLLKSSASMSTRFLQLLDSYPSLAKPVVECYGKDLVLDAIKTAATASTAAPTEPPRRARPRITTGSAFRQKTAEELGTLKIWVYDGTPRCRAGLSDKQAEKLAKDGVYLQDAREEKATSKAYKELADITLQNPDSTGLYEVLTKPGKFEKCLYVHAPMGPRGARPSGVFVNVDNKAWTETHSGDGYCSEKHSGKEYLEWFSKLPEAKSLEVGGVYILLTQGGQGTSVFKVAKAVPSGDGEKCYRLEWVNRYGSKRPDKLLPSEERRYNYDTDDPSDGLFLNYCRGRRFICRLGAIYAPIGARVFKIAPMPKGSVPAEQPPIVGEGKLSEQNINDDIGTPENVSEGESSDPPALLLGRHVDAHLGIYKTSAELKVFNNGTEAIVNGSRMSTRAGLLTLVRTYGLREKAAREILTEAAVKHGAKYRIKLADAYGTPPGVLGSPPTSPPFPPPETGTDDVMGSGLPTTFSQEQNVPIESMRGLPTRPNYADPPDPQMAQQIQQAAQTGQKEVLDTSMLSNLLRSSQDETLIDKHLPALMKGLDSLGRLLFNMYWHHDKFSERYGDRDLADLKDSMRNAFDGLGDVTLELKQDAIEPFPAEGVDVDFGSNR